MEDEIPSTSLDALAARFGEKPHKPAIAARQKPIKAVDSRLVRFEPLAYRELTKSLFKSQISYDESLAALRARGYARHARGSEHFGFRLRARKNKVSTKDIEIVHDMGWPSGEWLSHAIECDWDKRVFTLYDDPEGIAWDTALSAYVMRPDFTYKTRRICSIPKGEDSIPLRKFDPVFINVMYGSVKHLQGLLRGMDAVHVNLTTDKGIWPIVTAAHDSRETYSIDVGIGVAASRGVK